MGYRGTHRSWWIASAAVAALVVLALLVTAGGTLAQTPAPGGSVSIAFGTDALTLDPHNYKAATDVVVSNLIFDTLVQFDLNLHIRPALALDWLELTPTSWRFDLRQGVKFSDGTPFNAQAVKTSMERAGGGAAERGVRRDHRRCGHRERLPHRHPAQASVRAVSPEPLGARGRGAEPVGTPSGRPRSQHASGRHWPVHARGLDAKPAAAPGTQPHLLGTEAVSRPDRVPDDPRRQHSVPRVPGWAGRHHLEPAGQPCEPDPEHAQPDPGYQSVHPRRPRGVYRHEAAVRQRQGAAGARDGHRPWTDH